LQFLKAKEQNTVLMRQQTTLILRSCISGFRSRWKEWNG